MNKVLLFSLLLIALSKCDLFDGTQTAQSEDAVIRKFKTCATQCQTEVLACANSVTCITAIKKGETDYNIASLEMKSLEQRFLAFENGVANDAQARSVFECLKQKQCFKVE